MGPLPSHEKLDIRIATTNKFAEGGEDTYEKIGEVDAGSKKTTIDVSRFPSDLYKIVLIGEHNGINTWAIRKRLLLSI